LRFLRKGDFPNDSLASSLFTALSFFGCCCFELHTPTLVTYLIIPLLFLIASFSICLLFPGLLLKRFVAFVKRSFATLRHNRPPCYSHLIFRTTSSALPLEFGSAAAAARCPKPTLLNISSPCGKSAAFLYTQIHSCIQTIAGGAWQTTTTAAATVRSAIRRLKEQGVVA
jgi:hypothetical protein